MTLPPPPPAGTTPARPARPPRRWLLLLTGAALGAGSAGIVAAVATSGGDDPDAGPSVTAPSTVESPAASPKPSAASTVPSTTTTTAPPTTTTAPPNRTASGVVGETMQLPDGSLLRVNGLATGVPVPPDLVLPAGSVHVQADVEQCGGPEVAMSMNVLDWQATLADGSVVPPFVGSLFPIVSLPPGTCARGLLSVVVPEQTPIVSLTYQSFSSPPVTMAVEGAREVEGRLVAPDPLVPPLAVGTSVDQRDGSRVTVRAVRAGVPDPAGGTAELIEVDIEVCSGPEFPQYVDNFALIGADRIVAEDVNTGTMPRRAEVGQCVAGTIHFAVPAGWQAAYLVWDDRDTFAWQL